MIRNGDSEPPAFVAAVETDPGEQSGAEPTPPEGEPDRRASIGRNLLDMMSSQVVTFLLGFVAQVVQPRYVGPDGIGQVQLAFSIWLIAQTLITLGTGSYLTLVMAQDPARGRALVGPVLLLRMALFVVASIGVAIFASNVGYSNEIKILLVIAGSTMLIMALADTYTSAFFGLEQMRYPARITIFAKLLYTIVMVAVLVLGGGVYGLALTTTINAVLTVTLLAFFYRRYGRISWKRPPDGYRGLVTASFGFMVAGAVVVIYLQIDMITMSLLVDETALGWYTVADVLMSSLLFIPTILISVLFPVIGRVHHEGAAESAELVRRSLSALTLTGVAIGFGAFIVAEPFCALLYGEDFRQAGQVLAVFGIALPFIFATMMLGTVALATGHKRFWTTLMVVGIVVSICFNIVVVPLMDERYGNGGIGGALGYIVTEAMMVIVGIRRMAPTAVDRRSMFRLTKIVASGFVMIAVAYPLRERFLLVPIGVGAVVFCASILLMRVLTDDERALLRRVGDRLPVVGSRLGGSP